MRAGLVKLALAALGILGALFLLEVCFGQWLGASPANRLHIIRNADLAWPDPRLYPGAPATIHYRRDVYGLRGAYEAPEQIDLLTIGGSATDQRYITEGETWQDRLRVRFAESGRPLVVVNAGVDGHSTVGHLAAFDLWLPFIPGLKPKYMLYYIGVNDMLSDGSFNEHEARSYENLLQFIRRRSALSTLFSTARGTVKAIRSGIAHRRIDFAQAAYTDRPLRSDHDQSLRPLLARYEGRIQALCEKTRQLGSEPIFVAQASYAYKWKDGKPVGLAEVQQVNGRAVNGVDMYLYLRAINAATMDACKRCAAACLDLASDVSFVDEDFYDLAHNTPPGADKVAAYLFARLKDYFESRAMARKAKG